MIIQLKNGKIVHLTVDQYLSLTDKELDDLESSGAGDYAPSAFYGSAIRKKGKPDKEKEVEEEDKSLDFQMGEDDRHDHQKPRINLTDEEFSEPPPAPEDSE